MAPKPHQLGNTVLDQAGLARYAEAMHDWGAALRDGGDLLLYGCDVAEGLAGQGFVDALAAASSADVAASTDLTGAHGDWDLEYHSGAIEAATVLSAAAQQAYAADLALVSGGAAGTLTFNTGSDVTLLNSSGLAAGAVVHVNNVRSTGLDLYTQSSNGGGVVVLNANGTSVLGVPLTDDRLTVNGSLLSPVNYVDMRANSGVFDLVSINLGSGSLVGNLLGTVIFTVYALDANYQPTGVGVSLTSLVVNEYGLLNFASMADFKGIYGFRIVNPLGFEVAIDDIAVANGRVANSITSAAYNANTGVLNLTAVGIRAGDAIDPSKLTITGANGATYTLTSALATASSTTAASITLNAADKLAINGLLNNNGTSSVDGTSFNIAAAANWDSNLSNGIDMSGNPITVQRAAAVDHLGQLQRRHPCADRDWHQPGWHQRQQQRHHRRQADHQGRGRRHAHAQHHRQCGCEQRHRFRSRCRAPISRRWRRCSTRTALPRLAAPRMCCRPAMTGTA
jgi:hypothetical protein